MRHIRDPISNRCLVCEKNNVVHYMPGEGTKQSWEEYNRKLIYVNAPAGRSVSSLSSRLSTPDFVDDGRRRPRTRDDDELDDDDTDSVVTSRSVTSTSRIVISTNPNGPRGSSPSPRGPRTGGSHSPRRTRTPSSSPERDCCGRPLQDRSPTGRSSPSRARRGCCRQGGKSSRGCCKRSSKVDNEGGKASRYGYTGENETPTYGAGNWGKRPCLAVLIGLIVLLLLAGLAVGLYYGITAAIANAQKQQAIAALLQQNQVNYIVVGNGQPCNPANNNLNNQLNCNAVTTVVQPAPAGFVPPPDPAWALAAVGRVTSSTLVVFLAVTIPLLAIQQSLGY